MSLHSRYTNSSLLYFSAGRSPMFSNLGLFAPHECPEADCCRLGCFFSHDGASKRTSTVVEDSPSPKRPRSQINSDCAARGNSAKTMLARQQVKDMRALVAPSTSSSSHATPPVSRPSPPVSIKTQGGALTAPPALPPLKTSPQPISDRQKARKWKYCFADSESPHIIHPVFQTGEPAQ